MRSWSEAHLPGGIDIAQPSADGHVARSPCIRDSPCCRRQRRLAPDVRAGSGDAEDPECAWRLTTRVIPLYIAALVGGALSKGNRYDVLTNGDQFFPAMLDAIRAAQASH